MRLSVPALALAMVAVAAGAFGPPAGAQPSGVEGCYRADRPLGTSAGSALGHGVPGFAGRRIGEDSAALPRLTTFRLLPDGRAARPGTVLHELWAQGSEWTSAADTLRVTLSTRTSGWALRLVRASGEDTAFTGSARYLSDVVGKDGMGGPPEYTIRVHREPCAPPPNESLHLTKPRTAPTAHRAPALRLRR